MWRTSNAGQYILYSCLWHKKAENGRRRKIIDEKFSRKNIFFSLHPNASRGFYSTKKFHTFLKHFVTTENVFFFVNSTLDQGLGAN